MKSHADIYTIYSQVGIIKSEIRFFNYITVGFILFLLSSLDVSSIIFYTIEFVSLLYNIISPYIQNKSNEKNLMILYANLNKILGKNNNI